ncbi:response regulator [Bradyrhizobium sp. STM 3809]|uniref:response regulator n=1 Tax=Bradyrhizobium sp. STM 3809 TaxID=551936 RepID=UPI0002408D6F|nr:response regulator [Bradyrhizobium sp. STM 3809]CCE00407.1 response regulator receiver (CheY-like protein) [Bradyrhizobium sp. STM 3809]
MANILVVDDDPVMRLTIQRVLEHAGHVVATAAEGGEALARVERERFDLVILDIFMPGMDGLEAMRMILRRAPDIPILMTSGRPHSSISIPEPDYLTMATKLGAVSALPKPFKPAALVTMVSDCLASAGKQVDRPRPGSDAVPNS